MKKIIEFIKNRIGNEPETAIVLGSGLSELYKILKNRITINYNDIPNFFNTSVEGHKGKFVIGDYKNKRIIFALGRFHFYEGLSIDEVGLPIRIFKELNCKNIILTNSSGCLNKNWNLGDIMIINGHADFTFRNLKSNPTINKNPKIYNQSLINTALSIDSSIKIGNYGWVIGPMYETRAEIANMIKCNVSAVGMSTVPELLMAGKIKINILGLALMSNYGVGLTDENLTHSTVLKNSEKYNEKFKSFLIKLILRI